MPDKNKNKLSLCDSFAHHFPKLLRILACRKRERQNLCEARRMLLRITVTFISGALGLHKKMSQELV